MIRGSGWSTTPSGSRPPGSTGSSGRPRGAVIVRMDVHAEYAPDYVEKCVEALARTGADNVGGAQRCTARTRFQQAVCAALGSPLGMGGAAYRDASREGYVDTVFLGAFRRDVFDRIGLYDEGAVTNEDAEINQRLVQSGGRIYLSRDIHVRYFPRETFRALARQYFRYGSGRARTLLKHRRVLKLRPVLPFVALLSGAVPAGRLAAVGSRRRRLVRARDPDGGRASRPGAAARGRGDRVARLPRPAVLAGDWLRHRPARAGSGDAGFKAVDALDRRTAWAVGPSYRHCWARTKLNCSVDCGECCVSALSPDFTVARGNSAAGMRPPRDRRPSY